MPQAIARSLERPMIRAFFPSSSAMLLSLSLCWSRADRRPWRDQRPELADEELLGGVCQRGRVIAADTGGHLARGRLEGVGGGQQRLGDRAQIVAGQTLRQRLLIFSGQVALQVDIALGRVL